MHVLVKDGDVILLGLGWFERLCGGYLFRNQERNSFARVEQFLEKKKKRKKKSFVLVHRAKCCKLCQTPIRSAN